MYTHELSRYAGRLSLVAHNYARELLLDKRYDEALEMAELGRRTCVEYGAYTAHPAFQWTLYNLKCTAG